MLRIHFTEADLVRTRIAGTPDPLWEITLSLHRLQTRRGRWAYADWHRFAGLRLRELELGPTVRELLLPAFPRASYFPDFLTPSEAGEGLEAGLEAILAAPRQRVLDEVGKVVHAPHHPSLQQLADMEGRAALVRALRDYHRAVITPQTDRMQSQLDGERAVRARAIMDAGSDGLLRSLAPSMHWRPPVLELRHHIGGPDVHLNGRGLVLIPSYFCWHQPITISDPALPQVLVYPMLHSEPHPAGTTPDASLGALLGRNRAVILARCAAGATTSELARGTSMTAGSVSFHTRTLREAGLLVTRRHGPGVLHTLTPLGVELLRNNQAQPAPPLKSHA